MASRMAAFFVLMGDDRVQPLGHVGIGEHLGRFLAVILPEQVEVGGSRPLLERWPLDDWNATVIVLPNCCQTS